MRRGKLTSHYGRKGAKAFRSRFWKKVDKGDPIECWLWKGSRCTSGYGSFRTIRTTLLAHRLAYWFTYRKSIERLVVRHTCDQPLCCNPRHLVAGTQADNIRDRDQRQRTARGEKHGRSKLTKEQVIEIRQRRADGQRLAAIADRYGVAMSNVWNICNGYTWAHV